MSFRRPRRDTDKDEGEESNKFNRLFILGAKGAAEDELRSVFAQYGEIDSVKCVTDRNTGESRGISYITFTRASGACNALEQMNGKTLEGHPKPLKVVMASPRNQGNIRDDNEHEKLQRLFIMIPTSFDKGKVEEVFKEWGDVEYVNILKHRDTGKPKGLAYVKYYRPYHAALALESCDHSYKALFADTTKPKGKTSFNYSDDGYGDYGGSSRGGGGGGYGGYGQSNVRYGDPPSGSYGGSSVGGRRSLLDRPDYGGGYSRPAESKQSSYYDNFCQPTAQSSTGGGLSLSTGTGGASPLSLMEKIPHNDCSALSFLASPQATEQQMYDIFNIVPGFEKIQYNQASGTGKVVFQSPQCAAWAQNKINGFEFPPGFRMQVSFDQSFSRTAQPAVLTDLTDAISAAAMSLQSGGDVQTSIQHLAAAMQSATSANSRGGASGGIADIERVAFCNIPLPLPKPWATKGAPCAERLFFVSQPDAFPEKYLRDVFSRFSDLIEVYFIPRKNFGYAKYSDQEQAQKAVDMLHGSYVCEMRMKVMVAEPESNPGKRGPGSYEDNAQQNGKRFRRE